MEKILHLFLPNQEFQSWTTVTDHLEQVWFISPSVKKFTAASVAEVSEAASAPAPLSVK